MFWFGKHRKRTVEVIEIHETNFIIIEDKIYKRHDEAEEKRLEKIIAHELDIIDRLTRQEKQKPIFTLSTIINNTQFLMADVSLVLGTPKTGLFTLVDNTTLAVLTATFSNQALGANSNPEFATFAFDPANPNGVIATPVAAGSGTLVVTTHADYTDSTGAAASGDFTVTKNFTVKLSADAVSFDVVFP